MIFKFSWAEIQLPLGTVFWIYTRALCFCQLCVSLFYSIMLLLPMHISNLAVNIDWFLYMQTELILTVSMSSSVYSWNTSCSTSLTTLFLLLWQTFWKCPILLYSVHVLLYAGHCLGWGILPQYLQGCCGVVCCTGVLVLSSFTFFGYLYFIKLSWFGQCI